MNKIVTSKILTTDYVIKKKYLGTAKTVTLKKEPSFYGTDVKLVM